MAAWAPLPDPTLPHTSQNVSSFSSATKMHFRPHLELGFRSTKCCLGLSPPLPPA